MAAIENPVVGVSVVICCHNSAQRLPQTLARLAAQQVQDEIPWEVIIVDNASTDDTSQVAQACWPASAPASLRVVPEPQLGLSYARHRGFAEARFEFVSFVDDDNWVCADWVRLVWEVMNDHPEVGACGGPIDAVCETAPPWWFEANQGTYATGPQSRNTGDITWTRGWLFGAGLTIRKSAWRQLIDDGFRPLLTGHQGNTLTAGEDIELCLALRLAGWRIWYEPGLSLHHFVPAQRLSWNYLRRLKRGSGAASIWAKPYHLALNGKPESFHEELQRTWQWQVLVVSHKLLRLTGKLLLSFSLPREGNPDVLRIEKDLGRFFELLRKRRAYNLSFNEIR